MQHLGFARLSTQPADLFLTFMAMSLRTLSFFVLVVVGVAEEGAQNGPTPVSQSAVPGNETQWSNFVYCKCGLSCVQELGSWYIFNVGQSCSCEICPETNSTALRGSVSAESKDTDSKVPVNAEGAKSLRTLPSNPETWDSAHIPGSNLLYCPLSGFQIWLGLPYKILQVKSFFFKCIFHHW